MTNQLSTELRNELINNFGLDIECKDEDPTGFVQWIKSMEFIGKVKRTDKGFAYTANDRTIIVSVAYLHNEFLSIKE